MLRTRVPGSPQWRNAPVVVFFIFFLGLPAAFSQTSAQSRIAQAMDSGKMSGLRGNIHPLARTEYDRGRVSSETPIQGAELVFKLSAAQQSGIDHLLAGQQTPGSPNYHQWLTPEQYAAHFGMSQDDLDKVTIWLQSQGFSGIRIARSHNEIWFDGNAGQIETAFHTELHRYLVNGEMHFANASEPSVPAALAGAVTGFRRLDNFRPKPRAHRTATAHFTSGQTGNHFLTPGDVATIYDLTPLYDAGLDGTGVTIAVMGQTFINIADANTFRTLSGLPANPPQLFLTPNTGASQTFASDLDEANIDVEWSGGVAKGATILFDYAGASGNVFDALTDAIDNKRAPVLSISYGNCEAQFSSPAGLMSLRTLIQQGATQGQTLSAASGDSGAADCEGSGSTTATTGLAADAPGVIPEVISVGGSEFSGDPASTSSTQYWNATGSSDDISSAASYIPETVWNDTATDGTLSAGGGGVSAIFLKPAWQSALTPADGHRDVPDLSLNASDAHDSYLVCSELDQEGLQSCTSGFRDSDGDLDAFGGTSVSAQVFAGILAIANQATQSNGLGNANMELYALGASTPAAFHDITSGSNIVPCTPGTPTTGSASLRCPSSGTAEIGYNAAAGYDLATGLGSIDAGNLVGAWPGFGATPSYTVSATPITFPASGGSSPSTVTVSSTTGFSGAITLTCAFVAPPPTTAGMSCSIDPSVTLSNSATSKTATLTVTTTAAHARPGASAERRLPGRWFATASGTLLACVFFVGIPARRRRRLSMLLLAGFALLTAGMGCGGGSSSSGGGGTVQTVATPSISPAAGTYTGNVTVTFADAMTGAGALLFCTTDGTIPTASSPACATLNLTSTATVKAIAVASGLNNSAVASNAYTVKAGTAPGLYVVKVTATSGPTSHSTNVDVTVQ